MGLLASAEAVVQFPRHLLTAIFPDDCRVCGEPLTRFLQVPVCPRCLDNVQALQVEDCCERCGAPLSPEASQDGSAVCRLCRTGRRGFDASFAFGAYTGELRQLIHVFKYEGVAALARPLAACMLRGLPRHLGFDAVTAVPMHWWKRYRRGFNQASLLARAVSEATSLPVIRPLQRLRSAGVQAGLGSAERRRNATASFGLRPGTQLQGKRILLVDDVFTTGATATACARLLRQAGAGYVAVLTIARVDRRAPAPHYTVGSPGN